MEDIKNREDVFHLVHTFYSKVRQDELIGPIFNRMIQGEEEWKEHEEKLTDFWESTIFFKGLYRGNPVAVHNKVDEKEGFVIDHNHFGRWQLLWIANIQEKFEGENATTAKNKARNMAHHLFLHMFQNKPQAKV